MTNINLPGYTATIGNLNIAGTLTTAVGLFSQGGNSFGSVGRLGTKDGYGLDIFGGTAFAPAAINIDGSALPICTFLNTVKIGGAGGISGSLALLGSLHVPGPVLSTINNGTKLLITMPSGAVAMTLNSSTASFLNPIVSGSVGGNSGSLTITGTTSGNAQFTTSSTGDGQIACTGGMSIATNAKLAMVTDTNQNTNFLGTVSLGSATNSGVLAVNGSTSGGMSLQSDATGNGTMGCTGALAVLVGPSIGLRISTTQAVSTKNNILDDGNGKATIINDLTLGQASYANGLVNMTAILSGNKFTQQPNASSTAYMITWPISVASATGSFLTSDTTGQLTWKTPASTGFVTNGGNTTGAAMSVGSIDNYALTLKTNGTTALSCSNTQAVTTKNNTLDDGSGGMTVTTSLAIGGSAHMVSLAANSAAVPYTLTLPPSVATSNGSMLTSSTSGALSWVAPSSPPFLQGGSSFGAIGYLGTMDAYPLQIWSAGHAAVTFDAQTIPQSYFASQVNIGGSLGVSGTLCLVGALHAGGPVLSTISNGTQLIASVSGTANVMTLTPSVANFLNPLVSGTVSGANGSLVLNGSTAGTVQLSCSSSGAGLLSNYGAFQLTTNGTAALSITGSQAVSMPGTLSTGNGYLTMRNTAGQFVNSTITNYAFPTTTTNTFSTNLTISTVTTTNDTYTNSSGANMKVVISYTAPGTTSMTGQVSFWISINAVGAAYAAQTIFPSAQMMTMSGCFATVLAPADYVQLKTYSTTSGTFGGASQPGVFTIMQMP